MGLNGKQYPMPEVKWRRELHKPNLPLYRMLMDAVYLIAGRCVEMGVGDGITFDVMYNKFFRRCLGIDTFEGMTSPESPEEYIYP